MYSYLPAEAELGETVFFVFVFFLGVAPSTVTSCREVGTEPVCVQEVCTERGRQSIGFEH